MVGTFLFIFPFVISLNAFSECKSSGAYLVNSAHGTVSVYRKNSPKDNCKRLPKKTVYEDDTNSIEFKAIYKDILVYADHSRAGKNPGGTSIVGLDLKALEKKFEFESSQYIPEGDKLRYFSGEFSESFNAADGDCRAFLQQKLDKYVSQKNLETKVVISKCPCETNASGKIALLLERRIDIDTGKHSLTGQAKCEPAPPWIN